VLGDVECNTGGTVEPSSKSPATPECHRDHKTRTLESNTELTMRIIMTMLLVAAIAAVEEGHGVLRHRKLPSCVKKGAYCAPYPDDCCGSTVCEGTDGTCCIPETVRGCDFVEDCCPFAEDGDTPLVCLDSLCIGEEVEELDEERTCGIHGEPCNVTDTGTSCCGDVKYLCELVSISDGDGDTRCCMEVGSKGCSYVYHCCGEDEGNYCEESRCVFENGTYPGDSEGTRDCGLKGDPCLDVSECCGGETKYACLQVQGATNTTCCLKSNINGCSNNADCCDGHCDIALALCCIEVGNDCNHETSYECCTGYCNETKCAEL